MAQQYDHSQTTNLPLGRSPSVLAAIQALEAEGFYPGEDSIDCDIKTVTSFNEWEIKAGYSDTCLYLTVALSDGSRWLTDLENDEEAFPTFKELLNGNPADLSEQLTAIKQKKYERMMQAIAWVKELLVVRSPSPPREKTIRLFALAGFQDLGSIDEYEDIDTGLKILDSYQSEIIDGWQLTAVHREDLTFLDALHVETRRYFQKSWKYIPGTKSAQELLVDLERILRSYAAHPERV